MKLRKLAQSTVVLTTQTGKTMVIDPGKYNLDPGRLTLESFPTADIVVITHKHADHFDLDIVKAMLARSRPLILTNPEIHETLKSHNIQTRSVTPGTTVKEHGFSLLAITTDHVVRGEAIVNFGLVMEADGITVYHTSDTRFIDPSLLPKETRARYLLVPISNRGVVMGIDDALVFAGDLKPHLAIPIHYDSPKDTGRVDPNEFASKSARFGFSVKVLAFDEEIAL
jgi:L-ascorbate metabolism protein UlaG (beta-lactamase superfamily)